MKFNLKSISTNHTYHGPLTSIAKFDEKIITATSDGSIIIKNIPHHVTNSTVFDILPYNDSIYVASDKLYALNPILNTVYEIRGHSKSVTVLKEKDKLIYSGGKDGLIVVHDIRLSKYVRSLRSRIQIINDIEVRGSIIYGCGGPGGNLSVWDERYTSRGIVLEESIYLGNLGIMAIASNETFLTALKSDGEFVRLGLKGRFGCSLGKINNFKCFKGKIIYIEGLDVYVISSKNKLCIYNGSLENLECAGLNDIILDRNKIFACFDNGYIEEFRITIDK